MKTSLVNIFLVVTPIHGISDHIVTSQDVRPKIERTPKCALHSCIENLENFRAFNKPIKVIEVSLASMGIELAIGISAMNFDMTFAKFLGFWEKLFEFNSNMNNRNSNNNLNWNLNSKQ
jgi:hypothetical protein